MIHIHLKDNKKIKKDKTIIEGDIDAIRHGYNLGKKIMKQRTEKVYGIDAVTKKKVFIHEMPKDNTHDNFIEACKKGSKSKGINEFVKKAEEKFELNTQEIELKLVKRLKDSFPDLMDFNDNLRELRKLWTNQGGKDINCQDCNCCKAQNHLCHACLSVLRSDIEKESYGQGIQKAIDIIEDLKKSVEEVGYENLSDQFYYNALCDVKIQLNQEVKNG